MSNLQISHTISSGDSSEGRFYNREMSKTSLFYGLGVSSSLRKALDETDVDEDDIYTGEFVDKTSYYENGEFRCSPKYQFLKRKSKDTYVFLKDYKPKIKKIDSDIIHLEKNVESINGKMRYRDIKRKTEKEEFDKEIDVVNGLVNDLKYEMEEKNELLEEQKDTINKLQSFMLLLRKDFNEKIEKLEKKVYNLENPPLIPELKNPFDYFD